MLVAILLQQLAREEFAQLANSMRTLPKWQIANPINHFSWQHRSTVGAFIYLT